MTINKLGPIDFRWRGIAILEFALIVFSAVVFNGFSPTILFDSTGSATPHAIAYVVIYGLLIQVCMLALGLYNPKSRLNFHAVCRRLLISVSLGSILFSLLFPRLLTNVFSPVDTTLTAVFALVLLAGFRYMVKTTSLLHLPVPNVIVLGCGERASIIEKRMRRAVDRQNFNLLGFVPMEGDADNRIDCAHHLQLSLEDLPLFAFDNKVREIIVACDDRRNVVPIEILFACKLRGISIIDILDFFERETSQLAINLIYPSWFVYAEGFVTRSGRRFSGDQIFNDILAITVFLFTWPFMLAAIVAIKIEDGWTAPVFYTQERVGLCGRIFRIVKLRSMCLASEPNGAVWARVNDDRVTRVGYWIRKLRIDELPQLYNVLRGDMGFVGPRPERPEMIKDLESQIPYYNQRHSVKPGLTGWAQLRYPYGASVNDAKEKLTYDLYYVKHRSFLLDMTILCQTAEIILFGKGR